MIRSTAPIVSEFAHVNALIGPDFWRVRIGVGHPGIKELVQPHVLQNFSNEEVSLWVVPLLGAVAETIELLVTGVPDAFMSEVARRFTPPEMNAAEFLGRSEGD